MKVPFCNGERLDGAENRVRARLSVREPSKTASQLAQRKGDSGWLASKAV